MSSQKMQDLSKGRVSTWLTDAEFRMKNKWLNYSSKIALRILSAIEEKKDFSQSKLADLLSVSPQQISKIIKGKENLTLETIYNLSQALNVELISFPEYKYSIKKEPIELSNANKENYKYVTTLYPIQGGLTAYSNNNKATNAGL